MRCYNSIFNGVYNTVYNDRSINLNYKQFGIMCPIHSCELSNVSEVVPLLITLFASALHYITVRFSYAPCVSNITIGGAESSNIININKYVQL